MKNNRNKSDYWPLCSYCQEKLKREDITLIKKENYRTIFHTTCSNCLVSTLFIFLENHKGLVSTAVVTDLDKKEASYRFSGKTISNDEVLDAYQIFSQM